MFKTSKALSCQSFLCSLPLASHWKVSIQENHWFTIKFRGSCHFCSQWNRCYHSTLRSTLLSSFALSSAFEGEIRNALPLSDQQTVKHECFSWWLWWMMVNTRSSRAVTVPVKICWPRFLAPGRQHVKRICPWEKSAVWLMSNNYSCSKKTFQKNEKKWSDCHETLQPKISQCVVFWTPTSDQTACLPLDFFPRARAFTPALCSSPGLGSGKNPCNW